MSAVRALAPFRLPRHLPAAVAGAAVVACAAAVVGAPTFGLYATEGVGLVVSLLAGGVAMFVAVLAPDAERRRSWSRVVLPLVLVGFALSLVSVLFDLVVVAGDGLAGIGDAAVRAAVLRSGDYQSALARCAGLCVVALGFRTGVRAAVRPALLAGATLVAGSFLLMGHVRSHDPVALVAVCALAHVCAASAWTGGVVGLGVELRRTSYDVDARARLATTFAGLMTGVIAMLLAGGAGLAFLYLPSASALLTTAYGQVLLVKLGLVAGVLVVSSANHVRLVPAVDRGDPVALHVLRTNLAVEQVTLVAVLLVTEVLMRQSPT